MPAVSTNLRIVLRETSSIRRLSNAMAMELLGVSRSTLYLALTGKPVSAPFIAAVLEATMMDFKSHFEIRSSITPEPEPKPKSKSKPGPAARPSAKDKVVDKAELPTSYRKALALGYRPEPGPELFEEGSGIFEPDRITITNAAGVPVLAFEADETIRIPSRATYTDALAASILTEIGYNPDDLPGGDALYLERDFPERFTKTKTKTKTKTTSEES